jgi:RNA polymerase sigma-70 factor (ECF subfamily)
MLNKRAPEAAGCEAVAYARDLTPEIAVRQAVSRLPEKYRAIVILRFVEDMKLSEIARVLRISENTVKTRLYAALDKLRTELGA